MDLFGRHGFASTTVAQIEAAAGLSAGSGGLYRHFPSKRALLEAGLRRQADTGRGLLAFLDNPVALAAMPPRDQFLAVARAGLRRLDEERDVNRLLLRDLAAFPDLLEQVRQQELRRVFDALAKWLADGAVGPSDTDWPAVAAVLMAAVSHYWILTDVFTGSHPHGVSEDRFLTVLAGMTASLIE
jgi:AcrR family transcriptional regulator